MNEKDATRVGKQRGAIRPIKYIRIKNYTS